MAWNSLATGMWAAAWCTVPSLPVLLRTGLSGLEGVAYSFAQEPEELSAAGASAQVTKNENRRAVQWLGSCKHGFVGRPATSRVEGTCWENSPGYIVEKQRFCTAELKINVVPGS